MTVLATHYSPSSAPESELQFEPGDEMMSVTGGAPLAPPPPPRFQGGVGGGLRLGLVRPDGLVPLGLGVVAAAGAGAGAVKIRSPSSEELLLEDDCRCTRGGQSVAPTVTDPP